MEAIIVGLFLTIWVIITAFFIYRLTVKKVVAAVLDDIYSRVQQELVRLEKRIVRTEALILKDTLRGGSIYESIMNSTDSDEDPDSDIDLHDEETSKEKSNEESHN